MQRNSRISGRRVLGRKVLRGGGPKSRNRAGPPEFVSTMSFGHKFRFTYDAVGSNVFTSLPITRAMLLNLVTVATTTSAQYRLIAAIKLNRIQMWCQPPALDGIPHSISCEWRGANAPSTLHSDSTMGIRPAYLSTRPPPNSSAGWWTSTSSTESEVLCALSGSGGSIVDVDCSVRLIDNEAADAGEDGTGAGAVAGTVYWNYLDGFASNFLIPLGGVRVLP